MTTVVTDEHPADDTQAHDDVVATDVPCPCGYNLRGLGRDGRCPECGGSVADAIRWHQRGFGSVPALRRMVLGLAIVLAATVAWAIVLTCRGLIERGDRPAFVLIGLSGLKTLILPATFVSSRSPLLLNLAVPACHVLHVVGVWLFTTPHPSGRAARLRRSRLALRWCALLAFIGMLAGLFLSGNYVLLLGAASVADAVLGALWGVYLAGLAAALNANRLRLGGWIVALGSLLAGGTFACMFLLMRPNYRYWEEFIWTSLTAWAALGLLCTTLLAFLWRRLRRELSLMGPEPHTLSS